MRGHPAWERLALNAIAITKLVIKNLPALDRLARVKGGQGRTIHQEGDIVSDLKEYPAEAANRFLTAPLVVRDRDATNGCKNPLEKPDNLANGYFLGLLAEKVAAIFPRDALDPSLGS